MKQGMHIKRGKHTAHTRRTRSVGLAFGLALAFSTIPANAQVSRTDLLVAGRAIGFVENLKKGPVRVGIVYDPANAQSAQQANEIVATMGPGLRIGNHLLTPVMLPLGKLDQAAVDVFFLTDGLDAEAAKVGRASRERKLPCITFDLAQVRNGTCAMGVASRPRIEVLFNRAAAEASNMRLSAVFRIVITEI